MKKRWIWMTVLWLCFQRVYLQHRAPATGPAQDAAQAAPPAWR